jgi:hypothetical protein
MQKMTKFKNDCLNDLENDCLDARDYMILKLGENGFIKDGYLKKSDVDKFIKYLEDIKKK